MRPYNQRSETRDAILDAAERLAIRHGYIKVTMVDIAREAGLGKATVYQYFHDKESVALACRERIDATSRAELEAIRGSDGSPQERLSRMLVQRILMGYDSVEPYLSRLTDIFTELRGPFLMLRQELLVQESLVFVPLLEDGLGKGVFTFDDSRRTAQTLITATNSLLPAGIGENELGSRDEIEERARQLVRILVNGILTREARFDSTE